MIADVKKRGHASVFDHLTAMKFWVAFCWGMIGDGYSGFFPKYSFIGVK